MERKPNISLREAREVSKYLAELIRKASPYKQEGIKFVTKAVAKELLENGYKPQELIVIASAILQSVTEFLKESNSDVA